MSLIKIPQLLVSKEHLVGCDCWLPLRRLARLLAISRDQFRLDPDDYMYMQTITSDRGLVIIQYKHISTRQYLNIDLAGHTYRIYTDKSGQTYARAHISLALALLSPE